MADWWYAKNGERLGPVSSSQLRQLAKSGELQPTDMVFKEGASQWIIASSVNNLFSETAVKEPARTERFDRSDRSSRDRRDDDDLDDRDNYERTVHSDSKRSSGGFVDLLMFRKMVAPTIIMIMFWVLVVVWTLYLLGALVFSMIAGGVFILYGIAGFFIGLPLGLLAIRLYAELVILMFRMYETLVEINDRLKKGQP